MLFVLALYWFVLFATNSTAHELEVDGMRISWSYREDEIEITLSAPTEGWVAVGFNTVDDIVGAELVMARTTGAETYAEHRYVVAPGDHRPVTSMGRLSMVKSAEGIVVDGRVEITLRLFPEHAALPEIRLNPGQRLYLILAYSVSPDFNHHSRMRRHVEVFCPAMENLSHP